MADESVYSRFSGVYGDHTRDSSYEDGLIVDEVDFSDPEEFVDEVTDDGLCNMLILRYNFARVGSWGGRSGHWLSSCFD